MQRTYYVVFFISVLLQSFTVADEPLRVMSHSQHPFFDQAYCDQLTAWAKQFSVNDEFQGLLTNEISTYQTHVKTSYVEKLSASAMAYIQHLTVSGSIIRISCWKVAGPESLKASRDEYLSWMDDLGTSQVQGEFVVIRGPETVTENNGFKDVESWLPLILYYDDGWLFESHDEEFVNWKPSGDLVNRLNSAAGKSWFREARPTKVSKNKRDALLHPTFAVLGTMLQRFDDESEAAFAKRAAPSVLWEQFLRTQYFHTDSISGWRSTILKGQPVRYSIEISAQKGSEFADVLKHLRNQTLLSGPELSWCLAAASFKIPAVIGSQLGRLIPTDIPDPMAKRLALEIARSLQSGSLHMGSWLQKDDDESLLNGVIDLVPVAASDATFEATASEDENSPESVFARQEITPDGLLKTQLRKLDPAIATIDSQPSGAGALPVLFAAKLNVLDLARIGKGTDEFDLYEYCQDKYLRYICPRLRNGSLPAPYNLRPDDRKTLDALRDKIVGDDAERWTVSVAVSVHSRERQLAIRVSVGDELYGFLTVAEKYWRMAANNAVDMMNADR